jgi:hypothetical protein
MQYEVCVEVPYTKRQLIKDLGFSWNPYNKYWTKIVGETQYERVLKGYYPFIAIIDAYELQDEECMIE